MAIKSKSSKLFSILICVVLVLAISACATIAIPVIYSHAEKYAITEFAEPEYEINDEILQSGFVLYQRVMEQQSSGLLKPVDIFFPDLKESHLFLDEDEYGAFSRSFEQLSYTWQSSFDNVLGANEYIILDDQSNIIYGEHSALSGLAKNPSDESIIKNYEFLTILKVDKEGNVSAPLTKGTDQNKLEKFIFANKFGQYLSSALKNSSMLSGEYLSEAMKYFVPPENLTIILGVPKVATVYDQIDREDYILRSSLEPIVFPILLFVIAILIIIVIILKYGIKANFKLAEKLHLETMVILGIVSLFLLAVLFNLATSLCSEKFSILNWGIDLTGFPALAVSGLAFFFLLVFLCFLVVCIFYSLLQIREMGIPGFLRQRSYTVKLFTSFFSWLGDISITKKSRRNIIKPLIINFIILTIIYAFKRDSVFLLVLYSIFLFFWFSRKIKKATKSYDQLLTITNGMVDGNFDTNYTDDLGMFSSLGGQLKQIQNGFRAAIEAETKSQGMKTELIANVSHDLKTPLTSIITYIDLLKNSTVTPEDQKKYIDTLEQKSNRLKVLIEDLFEMSKVSSGNIVPQLTTVDLVSLLNQLKFELADESKKSSIEFHIRHNLEEARGHLDSEMTYRVFDNLMINVIKYSLPNTRAYIDIYQKGEDVFVEMKNTSAAPLDFSLDDLTERFVRGDESRNTEGSGLGLAIAKSFVDLQNGNFSISADGDLFKVTVSFPLEQPPIKASDQPEIIEESTINPQVFDLIVDLQKSDESSVKLSPEEGSSLKNIGISPKKDPQISKKKNPKAKDQESDKNDNF